MVASCAVISAGSLGVLPVLGSDLQMRSWKRGFAATCVLGAVASTLFGRINPRSLVSEAFRAVNAACGGVQF